MLRILAAILIGFIGYMACTKLPMPVEDESVMMTRTQTDTTKVDSTGVGISITVDTTMNVKEHFITL